ncbi:restriction endonuclease subunit S [Vibrio cholerae]
MSSKLPFSEIAEVVMGQSPTKENVNSESNGFPLLNGPTEFTARYPIPVQFTTAGKKFSQPDDILFCVRGSTTGRMNYSDQKYAIGRGIAAIRGKNGYPTPYVRAVIEQNLERLLAAATGSTFPNVGRDLLLNFEVEVTSPERATLANDLIVSLEDKIESNRQTNQTLEQIAQAIFKSWFVDFDPVKAKIETLAAGGSADDAELAAMRVIAAKTLDELNSLKASNPEAFNKLAQTAALFPAAMQDSELGEIPEGWDNGTIEDVMQFSSERVDVSGLNLRNYISTENMLENKRGITTASSLPSVSSVPAFNENEILISNIRPYFKKIWLTEFKGGRSPDVLGFSLLDPEETEFAYNLLYQDRFFEYMMTTSKGAKMPRGDKSAIKQFSFPLPQKELRLVFSKHVRAFYPMIKNTNKESEHLHALRDALLPELLSGNLGRS